MNVKRLVTLVSVPIRLSGAALLVFLAYQFPYVMLAILVLTILAAIAGLVASIVARRAVRMRSRTACVACDCRPLKIARICPQCHTPLLAGQVREMQPLVAEAVLQSAIALAWSSGELAVQERGYIEALLKVAPLSDERRKQLLGEIGSGLKLDDLALPKLGTAETQQVLTAAAALLTVDGSLLQAEAAAYDQLAQKLGVEAKSAQTTLATQRRLAWA